MKDELFLKSFGGTVRRTKWNYASKWLLVLTTLALLSRAALRAVQFKHGPTGNLTAIVAAPGLPPALPTGRHLRVFSGLGEPLSLVPVVPRWRGYYRGHQ